MMSQRCEIVNAVFRDDDDTAPLAAVTAVRSAVRDIFLAPKAHAAVAAAAPFEPALAPEPREVAQVLVGRQHDVATLAAVAAVGPALRDVLLAAEAQRAVAAAPRLHVNAGAVAEHLFTP